MVSAEVTTTPARKGPDLRKPSQLPRRLGGPNSMTDEVSMTETTASTSSLMQTNTNSNTDTPHTAECCIAGGLSFHLNLPSPTQMTLQQLEHFAERNDVMVFASGPETPQSIVDPAQLTDAVWEMIDRVSIGPRIVGLHTSRREEST